MKIWRVVALLVLLFGIYYFARLALVGELMGAGIVGIACCALGWQIFDKYEGHR